MTPDISALLVGDFDVDRALVQNICTQRGWRMQEAPNPRRALAAMRKSRANVVIANCETPGVRWQDVLDWMRDLNPEPKLVVASRLADEALWAEVLNLGGFDVVARPLDRFEVERVLEAAARQCVLPEAVPLLQPLSVAVA